MSEDNELMTLIQASEKYGVTANTLRLAIYRKRLTASKKGRDWFVTTKAVEDWLNNKPHRAGRPKTGA